MDIDSNDDVQSHISEYIPYTDSIKPMPGKFWFSRPILTDIKHTILLSTSHTKYYKY